MENQSGRWPEPLEFHDCVYFIIVSFCTVGYGDVTPQSTLGRITVIVMLSWSFIAVRPEVSDTGHRKRTPAHNSVCFAVTVF